MKKIIAVFMLALMLFGCAAPQEPTTQTDGQRVKAPDFTVYDGEGKEIKLSDFAGKPVVLNFWASWCGPCKREMPDFQRAFEDFGGEVQFMMVNLTDGSGETVESASAFIAQQGYTFPVYFDTAYSAAGAYGIRSIPTTFFIDGEGNVATYAIGMIDAETLQRGIDQIKLPQE